MITFLFNIAVIAGVGYLLYKCITKQSARDKAKEVGKAVKESEVMKKVKEFLDEVTK